MLTNGLLSGLVGITASCDVADEYLSMGIGCVCGLVYVFGKEMLKY